MSINILQYRLWRAFIRGRHGSFAVISALMGSLVFGAGMFAFEIARIERTRADLQGAADAAAIAAARELPVIGGSESAMNSVARSVAELNLDMGEEADPDPEEPMLMVRTNLLDEGKAVFVELRRNAPVFFGKLVNIANPWVIASATAELYGESKICIIALKEDDHHGIEMKNDARITGSGCTIFANSPEPHSIHLHNESVMDAHKICVSGGYEAEEKNFTTRPITDCPPQPDPLENRVVNPATVCTHDERFVAPDDIGAALQGKELRFKSLLDSWLVMRPGVYCGGIEVGNLQDLWFEPGVYVIKDGNLTAKNDSTIAGKGVAFHFTGEGAGIEFIDDARVELSAPETGPLAGILFYENKTGVDTGTKSQHLIGSSRVKEMIGTVYLPRGTLTVDTDQAVADESAFTVLIVNELQMANQPHLVLNTDYAATDVPVPDGIVSIDTNSRLKR